VRFSLAMSEKPGGYRPGAGRKSQWNRPTKMIRVPVEFEAELLAIAHRLDDGLDAGNTGGSRVAFDRMR
jgi:hypothetical protein